MSEYANVHEYVTAYSIYEYSDGSGIAAIPVGHAEPIVRCRDCRHYRIVDETYDCDPIYGCSYFSLRNARIDDDMQEPQDPDGFCAWGVRSGEVVE